MRGQGKNLHTVVVLTWDSRRPILPTTSGAQWCLGNDARQSQSCKANFCIFDRDGSNFISESEFLETCREHIEVLPACQQSAGGLASPATSKLHLT